jgi:type IV secretory pathway TrbD component
MTFICWLHNIKKKTFKIWILNNINCTVLLKHYLAFAELCITLFTHSHDSLLTKSLSWFGVWFLGIWAFHTQTHKTKPKHALIVYRISKIKHMMSTCDCVCLCVSLSFSLKLWISLFGLFLLTTSFLRFFLSLISNVQFFLSFSQNPTSHVLICKQNVSFFLHFLCFLGFCFFSPLFSFCGWFKSFSFFVQYPFVFVNL